MVKVQRLIKLDYLIGMLKASKGGFHYIVNWKEQFTLCKALNCLSLSGIRNPFLDSTKVMEISTPLDLIVLSSVYVCCNCYLLVKPHPILFPDLTPTSFPPENGYNKQKKQDV